MLRSNTFSVTTVFSPPNATPTPRRVASGSRILNWCPGEFIQPSIITSGAASPAEIFSLIDEFEAGQDLRWTLDSEPLESSPDAPDYRFSQAMGEFCYLFFHLGSDQGYSYFHDISERMNEIDPRNPVFLDNMGSYWQVAGRNDRKAARYYKKALRLDPEDYAARTNLELIQSSRSKQGRGSR